MENLTTPQFCSQTIWPSVNIISYPNFDQNFRRTDQSCWRDGAWRCCEGAKSGLLNLSYHNPRRIYESSSCGKWRQFVNPTECCRTTAKTWAKWRIFWLKKMKWMKKRFPSLLSYPLSRNTQHYLCSLKLYSKIIWQLNIITSCDMCWILNIRMIYSSIPLEIYGDYVTKKAAWCFEKNNCLIKE